MKLSEKYKKYARWFCVPFCPFRRRAPRYMYGRNRLWRMKKFRTNRLRLSRTLITSLAVTSLADLPDCAFYTLRLQGETLTVYGDQNRPLYRISSFSNAMLSEKDITELERDGLRLTSRSEVLELLAYLES